MADVVDPRAKVCDWVKIIIGEKDEDEQDDCEDESEDEDEKEAFLEFELLAGRTPFFKKAMASRCVSQLVTIHIPGGFVFNLDHWKCYENYLRTGRVEVGSATVRYGYLYRKSIDENGIYRDTSDFRSLVRLYAMGGHVEDVEFQDDIIDALIARYMHTSPENRAAALPDHTDILTVYFFTKPNSPLRRLVVDMYLWTKPTGLEHVRHADFLQDLIRALLPAGEHTAESNVLAFIAGALLNKGQLDVPIVGRNPAPSNASESVLATVRCCNYHKHRVGTVCNNMKRRQKGLDDFATQKRKRTLLAFSERQKWRMQNARKAKK